MRGLEMAGMVSLETGVLTDLFLRTILAEDRNCELRITKTTNKAILLYSIVTGIWIGCLLGDWEWYGQFACGALAAYLLIAAIQDYQTYQVYDFLHVAILPIGLIILCFAPFKANLISFGLYCILQTGLFMRMYGVADGLVFLVCAVFESRFGKGLLTYLLHMAAAFLVLGIVQAFKRNINRYGNLKEPVAFVPYIAATVWLFL